MNVSTSAKVHIAEILAQRRERKLFEKEFIIELRRDVMLMFLKWDRKKQRKRN